MSLPPPSPKEKAVKIEKKELTRLLEEGHNLMSCAEHFNCSHTTIRNRINTWGLDYKPLNEPSFTREDEDNIISLIVDHDISVRECAEKFEVTSKKIRKLLTRRKILITKLREQKKHVSYTDLYNRLQEGPVEENLIITYQGKPIAKVVPL